MEREPTLEQWRSLYEAAVEVKKLSPWEWMTEVDIFGVRDPESGEVGFVSVMGLLGEHYAVSLYPDRRALYDFWELEEAGPEMQPERVLEIPQVQLSFEDRGELENRDRKVIKDLGLRFRGRKEWPMFRSYRPGYLPWFVEAEEARRLGVALGQLLEVAPRFREDRSLLEPGDDTSYLVRTSRREGERLVWEDEVVEVPPPESLPVEVRLETALVEGLRRSSRGGHRLEMDLFMLPTPIQASREHRPLLPYMLLAVDAESGMVLGTELLTAERSLEEMWGEVPQKAAEQLAGPGTVPGEVAVRSRLLLVILRPLAEEVGFELGYAEVLPALEAARESLFEALG